LEKPGLKTHLPLLPRRDQYKIVLLDQVLLHKVLGQPAAAGSRDEPLDTKKGSWFFGASF
jgi:hypothetical protein